LKTTFKFDTESVEMLEATYMISISATARQLKCRSLGAAVRFIFIALFITVASEITLAAAAPSTGKTNAAGYSTFADVIADVKLHLPDLLQKANDLGAFKILTAALFGLILMRVVVVWKRQRTLNHQETGCNPVTSRKSFSAAPEVGLGRRYRALFENANDLIVGTGLDGGLLYVNTAWQETLDFNEQEIAELSIFQLIHSESLENFREGFRRAAAGVKIKQLETTFVSKYGKRVIVEGSLHCEVVDDEAVGIQCIFRDITERKRSASALKQSED